MVPLDLKGCTFSQEEVGGAEQHRIAPQKTTEPTVSPVYTILGVGCINLTAVQHVTATPVFVDAMRPLHFSHYY